MNKIAIIHYRVGRTDGVSLEIEKRKEILESLNYQVKLISGPVQQGADFIIDELEFDSDEVKKIKENSFKYFNNGSEPNKSLMKDIDDLSHRIEEKFLEYNSTEHFSAVLLHNIFSHGRHIAAASAFTRVAQKLQIPFICTNHDYYWEREEYKMPVSQQIKDYLNLFHNKSKIILTNLYLLPQQTSSKLVLIV
jgi:glycosyltransferase involved in cell wall biosynthesis